MRRPVLRVKLQDMKKIALLFLGALVFLSCDNDDLDFVYDPGRMHYDSGLFTAPFLPAGTAEAAAKFPPKILDLYEGRQIDAIELAIYDIPESCSLIIYGDGSGSVPGPVIYQEDIRAGLEANKWNTITLPSPITIPDEGDLWIAIRSVHPNSLQVIGCDPGPSKENGDWLYESSDGLWRSFLDRGGDDINWNIRAVID